MATGKPLISVVVPLLGSVEHLHSTLENIAQQTWREVECIIVDDASQDGSMEIAAEFARTDRRFRVIEHQVRSGRAAARNTGLRAARSELVYFVNAGDHLESEALSLRAQSFLRNGSLLLAGIVCGGAALDDSHHSTAQGAQVPCGPATIDSRDSNELHLIQTNQLLLRTHAVLEAGGFDEGLDGAEDVELWRRMLDRGYVFQSVSPERAAGCIAKEAASAPRGSLIWSPEEQSSFDVIFLPHKDYHVWTIGLCWEELKDAGVKAGIVDLSAHYQDEGVRSKALELGLPLIGYGNFCLGHCRPRLIVAFNDWEPRVRGILSVADATGISTACIVEGVQDYHDEDTGRIRHPYRTANHILLPGTFDQRYFEDSSQKIHVVGVPRIDHLRKSDFPGPPISEGRTALINSNFSYGVQAHARDRWVEQAVNACRTCNVRPVISRHPADSGKLFPELVTNKSFYDATLETDIVIQRFSSGMLEALAMKRPVIYFNPHGEKIGKFKNPLGAYKIAASQSELEEALADSRVFRFPCQEAAAFLDQHTGEETSDPNRIIAGCFAQILNASKSREQIDYEEFRRRLRAIDVFSDALSDAPLLLSAFGARHAEHPAESDPKARQTLENINAALAKHAKLRKAATGEDQNLLLQSALALHPATNAVYQNAETESRPSLLRKFRKLKRDPYRFFLDSGNPILRRMSILFQR